MYMLILAILIIFIICVIRKLDYKIKMTWLFVKHLPYIMKYKNLEELDNTSTKYIPNILMYLLVPFILMIYFICELVYPDQLLRHFYGGGVHSLPIALELDKNYTTHENMMSKEYWFHYFKKNHIRHPRVYATNNGRDITIHEKIDDDIEKYIQKPFYGAGGQSIKLVTFDEYIKNVQESNTSFVLQQQIKNYMHFRVLTYYDHVQKTCSLFYVGEYRNPGKLTTNRESGGKIVHCMKPLCYNTLNYNNRLQLDYMINKLCDLHKNDFSTMIFIGWDVLLNHDETEPYCLEGNPMPGVVGVMTTKEWNTYNYFLTCIKDAYNAI